MSGKKIVSIAKDKPLEKIYSTEYSVLASIGYRAEMQNTEKREVLRTHSRQMAFDEANECIPFCNAIAFADPDGPMVLSIEIVESKYCDGILDSEKVIYIWKIKDKKMKGEI